MRSLLITTLLAAIIGLGVTPGADAQWRRGWGRGWSGYYPGYNSYYYTPGWNSYYSPGVSVMTPFGSWSSNYGYSYYPPTTYSNSYYPPSTYSDSYYYSPGTYTPYYYPSTSYYYWR